MKWWRSKYVQLLEIERERLLAELSNKDMRLDQLRKELANSHVAPAAPLPPGSTVVTPSPKPRPKGLSNNFESWEDYSSRYQDHWDHKTRVASCEFCDADAKRAELDKEGIKVVKAG